MYTVSIKSNREEMIMRGKLTIKQFCENCALDNFGYIYGAYIVDEDGNKLVDGGILNETIERFNMDATNLYQATECLKWLGNKRGYIYQSQLV